ncbi:MAG: glyoxalase [Myxococcaceae bacterium]|nr:glyoxalase [Myxococcaceae bacterium]
MNTPAQKTGHASIIPCLVYRDAHAAIEWLCRAFGFEKHLVVPGKDNTIEHAELVLGNGNGMVMLGSMNDREFGRNMKPPDALGGLVTQSPYVVTGDPDAHYARAKAAGAKIVLELKTEDYGGRGYACRDLEGNLWSFGSYNPWQPPPAK